MGDNSTHRDPLGNVMVDSAQQLSGLKKIKRKRKPKRPQLLSLGKTEQKKLKKSSGKQKQKPLGTEDFKLEEDAKKITGVSGKARTETQPKHGSTGRKSLTPDRASDRSKRKREWSESTRSRSRQKSTSRRRRHEPRGRRSNYRRRYRSRSRDHSPLRTHSYSPPRTPRRRRRQTPPRDTPPRRYPSKRGYSRRARSRNQPDSHSH